MSKTVCANAIDGAVAWMARAEALLDEAIAAHGPSTPIGFPDTAYFLPVIYSFTGEKVETLADGQQVLRRAKELVPERPTETNWLPYLGNALDAGAAALFACELIEACRYLDGPSPVDGIWLGAASDGIMRERGIEFVDGTAPGFAAITGAAPTSEVAVAIARELQEKNLYVFMAGATAGRQFAEQLAEEGVQLGWESRLVPFGKDVSALIYALGFANRAALSFGGVRPGDARANLTYAKDRVFAFVLAFDEVDAEKYAVAAGAINYGFPVIADTDIPEILPSGICTYEHIVSRVPPDRMVAKALEVRGCKVRVTHVPVPVSYGAAFEGERIRKPDAHVEFGGSRTTAFEFVTSAELDAIADGEIDVVGPDIDTVEPGTALPLAIWVEVAGRKMHADYEPILERQIHHLLNGAEGLWHMGQRDLVWTRISREGFRKGLRLRHYGEILHARMISDYPAIVDKVKVTLITDAEEVERRIALARRVYDERNRRLESMTDESVDTFYSCLLCQSFAPDHVCIITPERLGLCGAYNWLDGRAAYEIDATGPNQPVEKGACLDPEKGIWEGVNRYVHKHSHKTVPSFATYSLMDRPMTSCGCFEVILAYVPELNGVMAVHREFTGATPTGMTFSTLAGNVGGGRQTPGFMGCGKVYLTSRKFLSAEGAHRRLAWMPKELKGLLKDDLEKRFEELGAPDLLSKIADETVATEPAEVRAWMERAGHPALDMEDMGAYAQTESDEEGAGSPAPPQDAAASEEDVAAVQTQPTDGNGGMTAEQVSMLKDELARELRQQVKGDLTREVVGEIIQVLRERFLGESPASEEPPGDAPEVTVHAGSGPTASERIGAVERVPRPPASGDVPVWTVTLGATPEHGGTRGRTVTVGGADCMPFHLWEGTMPHRPVVAMEVFDVPSDRYPPELRTLYGSLLERPADMAAECVERHGADLISVRLDGTHPDRGGRSPEEAVAVVRSVLEAVDVPLIVTGHNHYETINAVMKAVARACAGENLLINWVEQDNYRTIAGAALAYGHSLVAQSPIDVNIAKQMSILLTSMTVQPGQIVFDPMTGALGYGLEYTYSVMERIRLTALGGDPMLAGPMIVAPGQECAKIKECRVSERDMPAWGDLTSRAALWETATATSLLYAGADILILYHPEAARAVRGTIDRLMDARPAVEPAHGA